MKNKTTVDGVKKFFMSSIEVTKRIIAFNILCNVCILIWCCSGSKFIMGEIIYNYFITN